MNSWFTVKVKYTKQLENGTFKRVSEPYLLAAMTFTDAEARIYEELGSVIKGEFAVTNIARADYHDIFYYEDADVWYKCKVVYESASEDGDKNKKVSQNFLVSAGSVKEAYDRIQESLSTLMVDFVIPTISVSPIIDIFPYREELDREISRVPADEYIAQSTNNSSSKVYSAAGADIDDEEAEEDFEEEEEASEIEDEYSEESE
ncbi:MAG: DUF4494 domain-containing protein [Flavobacteriia bacterium]|nr:DUF4494 domain-containing protein [Flavobacteriia bacterium]OJX36112.1 MAG: hypothetical protein BGO87_06505 [Flavobacteriia bacterium 40-80]